MRTFNLLSNQVLTVGFKFSRLLFFLRKPYILDVDMILWIQTQESIQRNNGFKDGWMNGVLGHFYALSRLNWAGDNLG